MVDESYIPKEATQQSEFLKKYPEYDGRGIKIAIIDSDVVDTSLPGLQITSIGLPKILDAKDKLMVTIDTSTIVETQYSKTNNKKSNNCRFIIGLSGRKLNIPKSWKNKSDKWHIGSVAFKELDSVTIGTDDIINHKILEVKKYIKSIAKIQFDSLKDKIIDCIVWFDGKRWRACIDNSFLIKDSNLELVKVLSNYDKSESEFAYFDNKSIYCINVAEAGNSINVMHPHYDHGTMVAHVAAGYFPEKPESSGLAPGAQIVSMHSENIEKALLKCIELKVDIVNVSLGFEEAECIAVKPLIETMINEHGIIIINAAGNYGPFYASILPQYRIISEDVFLIGSILTGDQLKMKDKFEFLENVNSVQIYSSKGPLLSGARGIDFVAPGCAIVDLPKWYSQKNDACQGTSLAAPQVAGAIACLLSALKANNIAYTPAIIKSALANTAFLPEGSDRLEYGNGLIQISDAFEFIKKSTNCLPMKALIPVLIDDPEQKGILLYSSKNEMPKVYRYHVTIDSALDTKWILKCSNGENFISYSKTDNLFTVEIDTSYLEEGSINYAELHGIDPINPSTGPLFHLPITVICPADSFTSKEIIVKHHSITHLFLQCSSESRRCEITITATKKEVKEKRKYLILEYQQKKKRDPAIPMGSILKFTKTKNQKSVSFVVEENLQNFEVCVSHTHSRDLTFIFDINFSNANV